MKSTYLVVTIGLIATAVVYAPAVSTVMDKNNITGFAVLDNPVKSIQDILSSRQIVLSIVHQNDHILFLKSLFSNQIILDVQNIVVATTQLPLLAFVVYSYKNSLSRNKIKINPNKHLSIHVPRPGPGEKDKDLETIYRHIFGITHSPTPSR